MVKTMKRKFYVIGGGISGLNTARELSKRGHSVTLFEANSNFGGLAGYTNFFGKNLDLGPHIFHSPDKDIVEYLNDSFPDLFYERDHFSMNYKDGKFYEYPISKDFINDLPQEIRDKIYIEISNANSEKIKSALNFHDYIEAIAGPTLREIFFTKYPEKLWGMDTKLLDANWAPKRVQIRDERGPFYQGQWSAVGNEGTYTIIQHLIKTCKSNNVNLVSNEKVISLETNNFNEIVKIITTNRTYEISVNDIVINTIPLTRIAPILKLENPGVKYRGVILAYIHLSSSKLFPTENTDFVYIDNPDIIFNRISDQNSFIRTPYVNETIACCEITYSIGDFNDTMSESILKEIILKDFRKLNFIDSDYIKGIEILKLPEVYPMFMLGYREKVNKLKSEVNKFQNLYSLGSLAEFLYSDLQILFAKSRDFVELITSETSKINNVLNFKANLNFNDEITFLGNKVGKSNPCFLIAEIGLNHNGSIKIAKELIDVAKSAGFNAVKFQSYKSEGRSSASGRTSKYAEKVLGIEETDNEMFKKYELSYDDHLELFNYAKSLNMPVFSAPFDLESASDLIRLGVDAFKIASMEITNLNLIDFVSKTGKPIIISTGMASYSEIESALKICALNNNKNISLLQCTSSYPAPAETINLRTIETLEKMFKLPVGYSDHYHESILSYVSIPMGAKIIEKHVTLDRLLEGPDHSLSINPIEQHDFVFSIREIEKALGDGIKQSNRIEYFTELRFRKSFYFKKDLPQGHLITPDDIELKAPLFGLLPRFENFILGRKVNFTVSANQPVTYESIR
jgi:N,N'-diacetyllegionaminate synthase